MNQTFDSLYKQLNNAQKQAVDTIEGPVMVIAGPGTGKTSILTLRIANILKQTDTAPENILALTFTESGAKAMKKKLVGIVGPRGYKIRISTFHGFCNGLIKEFPEKFERIIGGNSVVDTDSLRILENILLKNSFTSIKPYGEPLYYIKPILNIIKNLKREAISIDQFAKSVAKQKIDFDNNPEKIHIKGAYKGKMKGEFLDLKKKIEKNEELIKVYEEYEKVLRKEKLYDYEDMIIETIKAFKDDQDFLLQIQEQYQYVLADEHQDANNAQNTILELLSNFHEEPNLFIVGDEKQAIFRFQGASLENFLYFKKKYPNAIMIHLEDNYRSTQNILDASHTVIENNSGDKNLRVKLKSHLDHIANISLSYFENSIDEYRFMAEDILEKIKEKKNSSEKDNPEIAILYRDNKDAFPIANILEKYDIPYSIESDQDILNNEHIKKLVLLLRVINNPREESNLAKALFADFLNIDSLDISKSIDEARKNKVHLLEIIKEKNYIPNLEKWVKQAKNKPFLEFFENLIRESGYINQALKQADSFDALTALFDEIKNITSSKKEFYLSDFILHIDLVLAHGLLIKAHTPKASGIRLMTAHKSKGLEFDYVYIAGVNDGKWGGRTKRTYFSIPILGEDDGGLEDERRLFYVALTRARKQVFITYNTEKDAIPSQFISEIDQNLISLKQIDFNDTKVFQFKESKKKIKSIIDKQVAKERFLDQGLAVTALNNYLECSWKYFFVNLLRIPQAPSKHQMYGIAMHESLREYFNRYKKEQIMSKKELVSFFEKKLNHQPLYDDYKETLEKGVNALSGYVDFYQNWNKNLFTEYSVDSEIEVDGEKVNIKGNLDKIEIIDDGKVNVVDYKTGSYKSKNKENYTRQLQFYKLLLGLENKFEMVCGELDFLEPDDKGNYKKQKFEISKEDVQTVLETTKKVSSEIMQGDFSLNACGKKDCEFCELSKLVKNI